MFSKSDESMGCCSKTKTVIERRHNTKEDLLEMELNQLYNNNTLGEILNEEHINIIKNKKIYKI